MMPLPMSHDARVIFILLAIFMTIGITGCLNSSDPVDLENNPSPILKPMNYFELKGENRKIIVTWDSVPDVKKYHLYWSEKPIKNREEVERALNVLPPYTIDHLKNGTMYYVAIAIENKDTVSELSTQKTITLLPPAVAPPETISRKGSISVSWQYEHPNYEFEVAWSQDSSLNISDWDKTRTGNLSYLHENISPGLYFYRIVATDGDVLSPWSHVAVGSVGDAYVWEKSGEITSFELSANSQFTEFNGKMYYLDNDTLFWVSEDMLNWQRDSTANNSIPRGWPINYSMYTFDAKLFVRERFAQDTGSTPIFWTEDGQDWTQSFVLPQLRDPGKTIEYSGKLWSIADKKLYAGNGFHWEVVPLPDTLANRLDNDDILLSRNGKLWLMLDVSKYAYGPVEGWSTENGLAWNKENILDIYDFVDSLRSDARNAQEPFDHLTIDGLHYHNDSQGNLWSYSILHLGYAYLTDLHNAWHRIPFEGTVPKLTEWVKFKETLWGLLAEDSGTIYVYKSTE